MTKRRAAEQLLLLAGTTASAFVVYLLALAAAALTGRRAASPDSGSAATLRFIVLIPARDEERTLPHTLATLRELDYPAALLRVVVIADNCRDSTAEVAAAYGAEVLERYSPESGKGRALAWAITRLRESGADFDAVVFLDADCAASTNLLAALESRLCAGARVVQADYVVGNPEESWASALRFAGFALVNTVRSRGKQALGLSCGIHGTGFAVRRELLERVGWEAFSPVEDTEYHLRLIEAGERVRFAPEAAVSSAMPTSLRGSHEQQARWERGKLLMLRYWAPRLVLVGLRRRDAALVHAGLEGLVPPQSALGTINVAVTVGGAALRSRTVTSLGLANLAGQLIYVLGGLWAVRAPATVYRALSVAPLLVIWKLALYVRLLAGRAPRAWERGGR